MKKYFNLTVVLTVLVVFFTACEKEGVYNPAKKISKVYTQYSNDSMIGTKDLTELWTWEAGKLLEINYITVGSTIGFTYEGNKIKGVLEDDGSYASFTYGDKSLLQQIDIYGANLIATITINHNGDKISGLVISYPDALSPKSNESVSKQVNILTRILRFMVSESVVNKIKDQYLHKSNSTSTTVAYEYDGNNVKTETTTYINDGSTNIQINNYTYDAYKNPFYGSNFIFENFSFGLSENNITRITTTEAESSTMSISEYTYTYDGKYPLERQEKLYTEDYEGNKIYYGIESIFYEYK